MIIAFIAVFWMYILWESGWQFPNIGTLTILLIVSSIGVVISLAAWDKQRKAHHK